MYVWYVLCGYLCMCNTLVVLSSVEWIRLNSCHEIHMNLYTYTKMCFLCGVVKIQNQNIASCLFSHIDIESWLCIGLDRRNVVRVSTHRVYNIQDSSREQQIDYIHLFIRP